MLQLIDVSKTFNPGTVNEKKALSHLNLELQDGVLQLLSEAMVPENQRCSMQSAEHFLRTKEQ